MDRGGFIQAKYSETVAGCDAVDCACGDKDRLENEPIQAKCFRAGRMAILAFACALLVFMIKVGVGTPDEFRSKRIDSIACGPSAKGDKGADKTLPASPNDGSCPHQFNSPCTLCSNDQKRKRNNMT